MDPTPAGALRSMFDLHSSPRHGDPHMRRDSYRSHHCLHGQAPFPPRYTGLIAVGDDVVTTRPDAPPPALCTDVPVR
jgi:hypothetical protein